MDEQCRWTAKAVSVVHEGRFAGFRLVVAGSNGGWGRVSWSVVVYELATGKVVRTEGRGGRGVRARGGEIADGPGGV